LCVLLSEEVDRVFLRKLRVNELTVFSWGRPLNELTTSLITFLIYGTGSLMSWCKKL